MLTVILTILKIIGIVILSVLGLAVLLVLLVLILPVKYRVSAVKHDEDALNAHLKITYFLRLFRVFADYDGKLTVAAKVLWFTVFKMEYPDEDSDSCGDDELDELLQQMDEEYESEFAEDDIEPAESDTVTETEAETDSGSETSDETGEDPGTETNDAEYQTDTEGNDTPEEPETADEDAPEDFFSKIKYKYRAICDKIDTVRSEYRYYRNVINSNEAHYALRCVKKALRKIFKAVLPRKIYANVTYGFSSPDITGKVYGLYCLIKNRFDKGSVVTPDFDREIFDGEVRATGHFCLMTILVAGISVLLNCNVRKIYRSFKKHNQKVEKGNSNG